MPKLKIWPQYYIKIFIEKANENNKKLCLQILNSALNRRDWSTYVFLSILGSKWVNFFTSVIVACIYVISNNHIISVTLIFLTIKKQSLLNKTDVV